MPRKPVGAGREGQITGAGAAIADWLRAAMRGTDGLPKMTKTQVIDRAGISRATFYRVVNGEGDRVDQYTLDAIGRALTVPPPQLERIPRALGSAPTLPAMTPTALLDEAQVLIKQAQRLIQELQAFTPEHIAADVARRARDVQRSGHHPVSGGAKRGRSQSA